MLIDILQALVNVVQIMSGGWVLFAGSKTVIDVIKARHHSVSTKRHMPFLWWTQAISVAVIVFLLFLYARPGAGVSNTGDVVQSVIAAAGPAVSEGGVTFNKPITCTNASCSRDYTIMLNTGYVDTNLNRTSLTFTLTNAGLYSRSGDTRATLQGGALPEEGVAVASSGYFSLAGGENQTVTFQFSLSPRRGIDYTLRITLSEGSEDHSFDPYVFSFA